MDDNTRSSANFLERHGCANGYVPPAATSKPKTTAAKAPTPPQQQKPNPIDSPAAVAAPPDGKENYLAPAAVAPPPAAGHAKPAATTTVNPTNNPFPQQKESAQHNDEGGEFPLRTPLVQRDPVLLEMEQMERDGDEITGEMASLIDGHIQQTRQNIDAENHFLMASLHRHQQQDDYSNLLAWRLRSMNKKKAGTRPTPLRDLANSVEVEKTG